MRCAGAGARVCGGDGEGPAHDRDARGLDGHALVLDLLAHIPDIGSHDQRPEILQRSEIRWNGSVNAQHIVA
jgi:hypothetical protein